MRKRSYRVNRTVLRWRLNVGSDGDDVTSDGKLFHVRAAATWNARSPTVERLVVATNSAGVDADALSQVNIIILVSQRYFAADHRIVSFQRSKKHRHNVSHLRNAKSFWCRRKASLMFPTWDPTDNVATALWLPSNNRFLEKIKIFFRTNASCKPESWRPPAVIWCPRSSICIMDLLALRTIPCLHENGLARLRASPFWHRNGLAVMDSVLVYGQSGGIADVGTGQTSGRTDTGTTGRTR